MEKFRLTVLALALAALAAGPLPASRTPLRFASGRTIRVEVADTPSSRERGLMFRRSLPKDYGMLFVFPIETDMSFWMKNTWVSLDIVFIGGDKRISRVHERVRPSTVKTTDAEVARVNGLARFVLELPAGAAKRYELKEGQPLDFEVSIPER